MMNTFNITRERSVSSSAAERQIHAHQRDMARLQEQLATGLRINRASDDASGYAQVRKLEVMDDRYAQHLRAVDAARLWVTQTQQVLDEIGELFMQAREHATRAMSDTYSAEERRIEAEFLEGLRTQLVDLMNARSGDEYLFAGTRSTVAPFVADGGTVSYQGNDGERRRRVGLEMALGINITGAELHDAGGGITLTEALQRMADGLRADDRSEMEAAFGELRTAHEHVQRLASRSGSVANRLTLVQGQLRDAQIMLQSRRSEIGDVDIAEAMLDFQRAQTGLQATLKATASLLQTSLLDYLP